jgi:hypothetical protein
VWVAPVCLLGLMLSSLGAPEVWFTAGDAVLGEV